MATSMDGRRISVGEWNVQVARRHEHLLYCPITGGRCRGEKCELWMVDTLECAIVGIAKSITTNGE
ncbi:hypothetical protein ES703_25693 [subsurface metagenome]